MTSLQTNESNNIENDDIIATQGFVGIIGANTPIQSHGVTLRISTARAGSLLVIADDDWPPRRRAGTLQHKLSMGRILRIAKNRQLAGLIVRAPVDEQLLRAQVPLVAVNNTYEYIINLAGIIRRKYQGKVIAVTGSSGKTSTVEMIGTTLQKLGHATYLTNKNTNLYLQAISHLTRIGTAHDFTILELAASSLRPDENASMVVAPNVAILTSIAPAHIQDMGDIASVAKRKANIFLGLRDTGLAVINRDIPHFDIVLQAAQAATPRIVTYGSNEQANIRLVNHSTTTGDVELNCLGERLAFNAGKLGTHFVLNSLAMLATLRELELDWRRAAELVGRFEPVAGRGQAIEVNLGGRKITLIDDAHNANPLSMRAALESFPLHAPADGAKRIVVLGDMLELGPRSGEYHAALIDPVLDSKANKVYLLGEQMAEVWSRIPARMKGIHTLDLDELEQALWKDISAGDCVIFKASNGTGLRKIVTKWTSTSTRAQDIESPE